MVQAVGKLRETPTSFRWCVEAKRLEKSGRRFTTKCWASCSMRKGSHRAYLNWKEGYDTLETTIDEAEDGRE